MTPATPAASPTDACPCGSGTAEASCCAPILAGTPARTAEALMRSRYTAYVRGAIDHVLDSHAPESQEGVDRDATERWSRETEWLGLEILATEKGGEKDDEGVVEFVARGKTQGQTFAQRERATFRRADGRWLYVDGKIVREQARRVEVPGRNEPCSCGSGVKYKRCHGR